MSSRRACALTITLAAFVGGTPVIQSSLVAARARVEAELALSDLSTVVQDAQELIQLRETSPVIGSSAAPRPVSGLPQRITAVLASRGLAAATLASFSSAGPVRGRQTRDAPRGERASLVLAPITLPEFGGFLAAWRRDEPGWIVTSIDLAPDATAKREARASRGPSAIALRALLELQSEPAQGPAHGGEP